jgi:hypothetical protein
MVSEQKQLKIGTTVMLMVDENDTDVDRKNN